MRNQLRSLKIKKSASVIIHMKAYEDTEQSFPWWCCLLFYYGFDFIYLVSFQYEDKLFQMMITEQKNRNATLKTTRVSGKLTICF